MSPPKVTFGERSIGRKCDTALLLNSKDRSWKRNALAMPKVGPCAAFILSTDCTGIFLFKLLLLLVKEAPVPSISLSSSLPATTTAAELSLSLSSTLASD